MADDGTQNTKSIPEMAEAVRESMKAEIADYTATLTRYNAVQQEFVDRDAAAYPKLLAYDAKAKEQAKLLGIPKDQLPAIETNVLHTAIGDSVPERDGATLVLEAKLAAATKPELDEAAQAYRIPAALLQREAAVKPEMERAEQSFTAKLAMQVPDETQQRAVREQLNLPAKMSPRGVQEETIPPVRKINFGAPDSDRNSSFPVREVASSELQSPLSTGSSGPAKSLDARFV